MSFLTDFADQAVILPLGLAIAVALAVLGWRRGALVWLLAICGTLGAMLALKILVGVCAVKLAGLGLRSPSGHTAAAAMVYGGLVALLGRGGRFGIAPLGFCRVTLIAAAIALLIGLTRIGLGEHTAVDVFLGGMVGCAGAVLLVRLAGEPPAHLHIGRLAAIVVAVVILTHGFHLQAEPRIQELSRLYGWLLPGCAVQARP